VLRTIDYVMIRENISVRADDYARTQSALQRFLRLLLGRAIAEQTAEERIVGERRLLGHAHALVGANRDHGGRYLADHVSIRVLRRRIRDRGKGRRSRRGAAAFACGRSKDERLKNAQIDGHDSDVQGTNSV